MASYVVVVVLILHVPGWFLCHRKFRKGTILNGGCHLWRCLSYSQAPPTRCVASRVLQLDHHFRVSKVSAQHLPSLATDASADMFQKRRQPPRWNGLLTGLQLSSLAPDPWPPPVQCPQRRVPLEKLDNGPKCSYINNSPADSRAGVVSLNLVRLVLPIMVC